MDSAAWQWLPRNRGFQPPLRYQQEGESFKIVELQHLSVAPTADVETKDAPGHSKQARETPRWIYGWA